MAANNHFVATGANPAIAQANLAQARDMGAVMNLGGGNSMQLGLGGNTNALVLGDRKSTRQNSSHLPITYAGSVVQNQREIGNLLTADGTRQRYITLLESYGGTVA